MAQVEVIDLHLTACENVPRPFHPTHTMWIITGRREYRDLVPRSTISSPFCATLWLDKGKISQVTTKSMWSQSALKTNTFSSEREAHLHDCRNCSSQILGVTHLTSPLSQKAHTQDL